MSEEEQESGTEGEMTFLEHLEEMRGVILRSLAVFMVALTVVLIGFHYFNSMMLYPLNAAKSLLAHWGSDDTPVVKSVEEQKMGPLYLVSVNEDGSETEKTGPFYIIPKNDTVILVKDADGQHNKWYDSIKLRSMSFATPIIIYFYVGMLGALCISLPIIMYFIAGFVAPGLTKAERGTLRPGIIIAIILFFLGASFAFFFMLPMGIAFMSWMSQNMQMEMFPDAQSYYNMVIFLTIAVGVVFELPLIQTILIYLGIINTKWLRKNRRMVFLILLIFATIITPPDFITQLSLTFPLYFMYEISMFIGDRMRNRKLEREERREREEREREEQERKEYARTIAKERIAEKEAEEADEAAETSKATEAESPKESEPAQEFEIDRSHYVPPSDNGYDPTKSESSHHFNNYGYTQLEENREIISDEEIIENFDDNEDVGLRPYIDYGRLARPSPNFSPNWDLNKPDTSFMSPDWNLNDKPEADNGDQENDKK